ncbi:MAG: NAD(P)H-dependent oxidoreductase [Alphaproteobacteria bacterium]|nr:NAD(P)H-dependent oxidoreductase [Alphaproteobacteria bacterium]
MHTLLRLDCSPNADAFSRRLGDAVVERLRVHCGVAEVIGRDLAATPPPPVDPAFTRVMRTHQTAEAAREVEALTVSETLIAELEASDALLLTTPMHNFTVPAVLKLWLDQVVRFGRTFRSTPEGKIGLLPDRPTFVCIASGSAFVGEPARQPDFLTPYLSAILACIGLHDVTYFRAEAAGRDPERVMAQALAAIAGHPTLAGLAGTPA